jgi:hypothetical protein
MLRELYRDNPANRRRSTLFLFYFAALLCVIAAILAERIPSFRTLLFVLSASGAAAAIYTAPR